MVVVVFYRAGKPLGAETGNAHNFKNGGVRGI